MSKRSRQIFEFGSFRLDAAESLLARDGQTVPLPPKVFEILLVLVENSGRVLDKEELMRRVWPDTYVEENNLTVSISALRKALGEGANGAKYIETVPKRGYRFVADVCALADETASLILTKQTVSSITIEEVEEDVSEDTVSVLAEPRAIDPAPLTRPAAVRNRRFTMRAKVLLVALVVAAVAVTVYVWLANRSKPIQTISDVRSIAVLPFKSLGAVEEDESLGLGLADALITKLSNINPVIIRPTNAIIKYADSEQSLPVIGRELGVEALLAGRIQRAADRIRITVQLVRTDNGAPLWAESFDEQFTNIFAVQTAISERVARALTLKLTSQQQQQLGKNYTQNAEAFQAYIKGRYFWNKRTSDSVKKAISYFEQAIEIDPTYALAYAGIADCYIVLGLPQALMGTTTRGDDFKRAKEAALKALEIDEHLAEAHTSLAATLGPINDEAAHREYERAIELNPNYATAYNYYGVDLLGDGRPEEAVEKIKRALEIDPLSIASNTNLGVALYRSRRYDEAIERFKKSIELSQDYVRSHWGLGLAYEQKGMVKEAIAELERAVTLSNRSSVAVAALAHVYAVTGRRQEAQKLLTELQEMYSQGHASAFYVAAVYVGLGEKDAALTLMESHKQELIIGLLKIDQYFDPLRDDPRFARLLQFKRNAQ